MVDCCAILATECRRKAGKLTALQHRLFVCDEGSLLPTDGADSTFGIPMPDRLGGFDNSDDRRRLLLLTAPEEAIQALKPSGAAPESRALQERAARPRQSSACVVRLGTTPEACRASIAPCMPVQAPTSAAKHSTLGGGVCRACTARARLAFGSDSPTRSESASADCNSPVTCTDHVRASRPSSPMEISQGRM